MLPTMKKPIPQSAALDAPPGPIEDSKFHDKEAEAVIQYAEQEKAAENERLAMGQHDPITLKAQEVQPSAFDDHIPIGPIGDGPGMASIVNPGGVVATPSMEPIDPGLMVPVTPPRDFLEIDSGSPRQAASARPRGDLVLEEDDVSKRARTEESKRQRINRIQMEYESRLNAVKIAYKEYFTMDDYSTELDLEDDGAMEEDIWAGENEVQLGTISEHLWADFPIDVLPTQSPEKWAEDLADDTEAKRLVGMGALVPAEVQW